MATSNKDYDCVVCGSLVVDMLIKPVPLSKPIGGGLLFDAAPIQTATGGIVANSGTAMTKLGMKVAAFSSVGNDDFGDLIKRKLQDANIDTAHLSVLPYHATSTTAVLIDPSGERTFAHHVGAPAAMNQTLFLDHLDLFARSKFALFGYYSLMPDVEPDLPVIFQKIRSQGCMTAMDAAGQGGSMSTLNQILPELDLYVPSYAEAKNQTGESDPETIIKRYRSEGAAGILGVKLGSEGALLCDQDNALYPIEAISPPGDVIDTTGAGDSFYAGLITGLLNGFSLEDAGKLGAATGACCVTGLGAAAGLKAFEPTAALAGLTTL